MSSHTSPRRSKVARDMNLSRIFPVSWMVGFRMTWMSLLVACATTTVAIAARPESELGLQISPLLLQWLNWLALGAWGVWGLRFLYEQIARLTLFYGIEDGHFVIARGVIIRERGGFPLARLTDMYLESSLINLLLGVRTLHLATPTTLSEKFARIDGLDARVAVALLRRLSRLVDRSITHEPRPRESHERRERSSSRDSEWSENMHRTVFEDVLAN